MTMNNDQGSRMLVARHDLHQVRFAPDSDAPATRALDAGEVRLEIAQFALTANNITYAAFGESMHYWRFFPAPDAAWGCIPAWGFATVAESRAPEVEVGQRLYGYLPMGTHLVVRPARVSGAGFVDASVHRQDLPAIYNYYNFCAADPGYDATQEAQQAILRPLFTTSFLIDDFLADNGFFGARQVILSSASSKTAYGTAFCIRQRAAAPTLAGLTSPPNMAFTQSLGCYAQVLQYSELAMLDRDVPAIYIDFAGNAALRLAIHEHLGEALKYSCSVGGTHWGEFGGADALPGPKPVLFFAPSQAKKRGAPPPDGWGMNGLQQRVGMAWRAFMERVNDPREPWLRVRHAQGAAKVESAYRALLAGGVDARQGLMLTL